MPTPRKPTALKLLQGTAQKCRTNKHEPKPKPCIPLPPTHLSHRALTAWPYIAELLHGMQVLSDADPLALGCLCEAYADMLTARASLNQPLICACKDKDTGEITNEIMSEAGERYYWTSGQGGPMRRPRPELADISDADRRIQTWVTKFGLTPADRSRVSASGAETEQNPFLALK